jgi:WD40 repeat protein
MSGKWRVWAMVVLIGALLVGAYCNTPLHSGVSYVIAQTPDTGPYTLQQTLGRGMVRSVAWSPDGNVIAVGGVLGIWLYTPELEDIGLLKGHTKAVYGLAFSPDSKRLASASHDMTVRIWDVDAQTELHTMTGHTGLTVAVAWSPDGSMVASGSYDKTVRLWDADTGDLIRVLAGHTGWVNRVLWSNDGSIFSASVDTTIRKWDPLTGETLLVLGDSAGSVTDMALSPDGRQLISVGLDGVVRRWDVETGQLLAASPSPASNVERLAFKSVAWSPDGERLALAYYRADQSSDVSIWNAPTFQPVGIDLNTKPPDLAPDMWVPYTFDRVVWSPDGARLATLAWDETLNLWNAATGRAMGDASEHTDWIAWVGWDFSDIWVETSTGLLKIWRISPGRPWELMFVTSASAVTLPPVSDTSPDGTRRFRIDSGVVRILDTASGDVIAQLPGFATAAAWSPENDFPEGIYLAVAMANGTVQIWKAE